MDKLSQIVHPVQVIEFVKRHVGAYTPLLAGNSVYVDYLFLKVLEIPFYQRNILSCLVLEERMCCAIIIIMIIKEFLPSFCLLSYEF